jgi:CheY-like chemotaxis protein
VTETEKTMTKRVLIVDDDASVRRVLARSFERAGFAVGTAPHGEAALGELSAAQYDVMICDIQMPRMSGPMLCRHLATTGPYLPRITLIVTSRSEDEERAWVSAFPGVSVVEKPVGPKHLLRLVRERLDPGVEVDR